MLLGDSTWQYKPLCVFTWNVFPIFPLWFQSFRSYLKLLDPFWVVRERLFNVNSSQFSQYHCRISLVSFLQCMFRPFVETLMDIWCIFDSEFLFWFIYLSLFWFCLQLLFCSKFEIRSCDSVVLFFVLWIVSATHLRPLFLFLFLWGMLFEVWWGLHRFSRFLII